MRNKAFVFLLSVHSNLIFLILLSVLSNPIFLTGLSVCSHSFFLLICSNTIFLLMFSICSNTILDVIASLYLGYGIQSVTIKAYNDYIAKHCMYIVCTFDVKDADLNRYTFSLLNIEWKVYLFKSASFKLYIYWIYIENLLNVHWIHIKIL